MSEKTIANGWWKQASFTATDGKHIEVWQHDLTHYVVEYYDHRGVHMDASDYHTDSLTEAMRAAEGAIAACDTNGQLIKETLT